MPTNRSWSTTQLLAAVEASTSLRSVLRKLGLVPTGGNYETIESAIRAAGFDTHHFGREVTPSQPLQPSALRDAIATSNTLRQAMRKLGMKSRGGDYARIRRLIEDHAIDISHFRGGSGARTRWTLEELRNAVVKSTTYRQVLLALNLRPLGGNYKTIQRHIQRNAIDVSHFLGQAWARGTTGMPQAGRRKLEQMLVAKSDVALTSHRLRNLLIKAGLKPPHCERCGWAERTPDGYLPLELEHINGDRADNRIENLLILCPNCHSLTPTYRGRKNKRK